eukprot:gnl/TRDRNA2_/TRDRNA2_198161_c0_seq1.p1 gnl/TRDRNA2_/TRDRNA2_198161_c0~~gnl/TRDRNA2_/TRDRNA2_198161_c0_seq1.p1  ORF type:complete len:148 (+),score=18.65 gnl/TRDRNA2_/TRDRNA2_198161_c0_seq1:66-509(+)
MVCSIGLLATLLAVAIEATYGDLDGHVRRLQDRCSDQVTRLDVCKCVMGCEVFGAEADGTKCDVNEPTADGQAVIDATGAGRDCDIWKCGVYCLNILSCYPEDERRRCNDFKNATSCDVNCNSSPPTSRLSIVAVAVTAVVGLTSCV